MRTGPAGEAGSGRRVERARGGPIDCIRATGHWGPSRPAAARNLPSPGPPQAPRQPPSGAAGVKQGPLWLWRDRRSPCLGPRRAHRNGQAPRARRDPPTRDALVLSAGATPPCTKNNAPARAGAATSARRAMARMEQRMVVRGTCLGWRESLKGEKREWLK